MLLRLFIYWLDNSYETGTAVFERLVSLKKILTLIIIITSGGVFLVVKLFWYFDAMQILSINQSLDHLLIIIIVDDLFNN